jgi:uncharacterized membrane protein
MTSTLLPRTLTLTGALGAGLVAGVFFAFSTFVMTALGEQPDAQGLAAMQAINRDAPNPLFMTVLFGTALICVVLAVSAATRLDQGAARFQLAGGVLYLVAVIVTAAYHVPRNDALALLDPNAAGSAEQWRQYLSEWTTANHVRTLASCAGAVALTLALIVT